MNLVFLWLTLAAAPTTEALTPVLELIPDAVVDLRYATADNFMKKQVYPAGARCLLLRRSATMLKAAADALRHQGYRLRLYDCYRPRAVQYELWKVMPVPGYVADPAKGSNHNRGGAVDLSLVTLDGGEVEMPTPYDTFSPAAHQGYDGGTGPSRKHRELLKAAMLAQGFVPNRMEWWHYDLPDASKYPLRDEPFVARAKDALLERLEGRWRVLGEGEDRIDARFTLEDRVLELRLSDATLLISADDATGTYRALRADTTGAMATGEGQRIGQALVLTFTTSKAQLRKTFTPTVAGGWTVRVESKTAQGAWAKVSEMSLARP